MTSKIYLEIISDVNDNKVNVTLETYVTLFVFRYIRAPSNISICLIQTVREDDSANITIDVSSMQLSVLKWDNSDFQKQDASLFKFPVLVNNNCVIAGLCGVCRGLLKLVDDVDMKKLLGFKEGCLQAPSETSIWTKFCEIDFMECTKNLMKLSEKHFEGSDPFELPEEFGTFEKHLSLPVRMHNVYKVARNIAKQKKAPADIKIENQLQGLNIETREKLPRINKHNKSTVSFVYKTSFYF